MTKSFSNSSTKIRKLGIFGPKFEDFCFCTKLCYKTNYRVMITKMTIDFQSCSPKHTNKATMKLCNQRNWRALITNMTIVFENSSPKTQQSNFGPEYFFFFLVLYETLHPDKFQDPNFKYGISFLKFQSKIPNYGNFGPKLKEFCFWTKFCVWKNLKVVM